MVNMLRHRGNFSLRSKLARAVGVMRQNDTDQYLEQCKSLSLTARLAVALHVFDAFCRKNSLISSEIAEFISYMWQWPRIHAAGDFSLWESERPCLVNYGLGDPLGEGVENALVQAGVEELKFRTLVEGVVEILWGSFYGAAEDAQSLKSLHSVVNASGSIPLPPLTPFKFSRFCDGQGWGEKISADDHAYWKSIALDA